MIDFSRSFVHWSIDTRVTAVKTVSRPLPMTLNRVRMPIEAVIEWQRESVQHRYALTADCRTEQVWVPRDIWHEPNASMCLIAGEREALIEKQWDVVNKQIYLHPPALGLQPERQMIDPAAAFTSYRIDIANVAGERLEIAGAIHAALASNRPVVATTLFELNGCGVSLAYPVKVVNFSEREGYVQTDTGPVLFPLVEPGEAPSLAALRKAYIAQTGADWFEVIVNVPTPVTEGVHVHHYGRSIRVEGATHQFRALA